MIPILKKLARYFLWRIITSSAKPEKRIVAHKASIIEIVKITIEGAHEPLSSSYSSGQSIYFGGELSLQVQSLRKE